MLTELKARVGTGSTFRLDVLKDELQKLSPKELLELSEECGDQHDAVVAEGTNPMEILRAVTREAVLRTCEEP
jgi:hypothetical protein